MKIFRSFWSRFLLGAVALGGLAGVAALFVFYSLFVRDLPDFRSLEEYRPPLASQVVDRTGRPVGEFFEQRRRLVALAEVPEHVVFAFVAGEDESFFEHSGIDYVSILRAAWVNLVAGGVRQGASTITQQVAKSLLLTSERTYTRKLKDMILARRIEERLSKQEILFLYLNQIYFGSGAYGISEAARTYFGKEIGELNVSEGAQLAGLPKAPSRYSPRLNPRAAEERRLYVLGQMRDKEFIDEATWATAVEMPPELGELTESEDFEVAAYFTEEVRRHLYETLGSEAVLRGGLRVETTLDLRLQKMAVASLRKGLEDLDHRLGYRGPLRKVGAADLAPELERLASKNGFDDPDALLPPELPLDGPVVGVVIEVRPTEQLARIGFGAGLAAELHLESVKWARTPDPKRYPYPVKSIGHVLEVGDVAEFVVIPRKEADPEASTSPDTLRVTLHQVPEVQGALLCLSVENGDVLALVGGYDFADSEFNRAIQARRQPGSAFKPLIYAAALTQGYTPVSILYDRPVIYDDPESGFTWRPQNYGRRFLGPLTMREALARSVNNATIHLARDIGVDTVLEFASRLGVVSPLERNLSMALGSSALSLFELTRAYTTFPAGGYRVTTPFIRRVTDRDGNVLLENVLLDASPDQNGSPDVATAAPDPLEPGSLVESATAAAGGSEPWNSEEPVLDAADAYLATELLRAVVEEPKGTGRKARRLGRALGGKTGTTNDQGDAWFVGFSPTIASGVWVGFDEKRVLGKGETGGRAALPIWIDYMGDALADTPSVDFKVPEGIVFSRIDRATGLLADATSEDTFFQAFRAGTEPEKTTSAATTDSSNRRRLRIEF